MTVSGEFSCSPRSDTSVNFNKKYRKMLSINKKWRNSWPLGEENLQWVWLQSWSIFPLTWLCHVQVPVMTFLLFSSLEAQSWQPATALASSWGGVVPNRGSLPSTSFLSLSHCLSQAHSGHAHGWLPHPCFPCVAVKLTCLLLFLTQPIWHIPNIPGNLSVMCQVSCYPGHMSLA